MTCTADRIAIRACTCFLDRRLSGDFARHKSGSEVACLGAVTATRPSNDPWQATSAPSGLLVKTAAGKRTSHGSDGPVVGPGRPSHPGCGMEVGSDGELCLARSGVAHLRASAASGDMQRRPASLACIIGKQALSDRRDAPR